MVRKGKDLFVMLAERQRQRTNHARRPPVVKRTAAGKSRTGERDLGATLARWVQVAMRTLGRGADPAVDGAAGDGPAAARQARPDRPRTRPGRRPDDATRRVPRGLLVPGWLLAGMVIASLGCGFVLGRTLHGAEGDRGLAKGTAGAESPAGFGLRGQAGYLDDAADQAVLGHEFYVVRLHVDAEKHKAAHLAQQLRALGLHRARIRRFHSDEGSTSLWATLCYASSISAYGPAENQECWDRDTLLELNKHAAALGYDEIARPLKAPIPDATRPPGDGR